MDLQTARILAESLLERAEADSEKTYLTSIEVTALRVLLGSDSPTEEATASLIAPKAPRASSIDPVINLNIQAGEIDNSYMMCLDFGTSFSKAFAHSSAGSETALLDLKIGSTDNGGSELLLPSELFIDGLNIYFGVSARSRFNDVEAEQERLIDSPKQYLTLGSDVTKLDAKDLPRADKKDPNRRLKQRDALVLYLSHLNFKAENALAVEGHSINIKRRYTHPAWDAEINKNNKIATRRILAEAIIISRAYPDLISEQADLEKLVPVLAKAKSLTETELDFAYSLIGDAVREATAAGSGALLSTKSGKRDSFIVVDIGAGTTDVAGCYCVHNANTGVLSTFEELNAAKAIRKAGNALDSGLLMLALNKLPYENSSTEYELTKSGLQKRKREYKEILFSSGEIVISLPDDTILQISLEEFLQQKSTQSFIEDLSQLIKEAAMSVSNNNVVYLIPTGGGANLPIFADIVENLSKNEAVQLEMRDAMPAELQESNPDLIAPYPQLAVAVGGSMPDLPEQKRDIKGGIKDPGKREMVPSYKS